MTAVATRVCPSSQNNLSTMPISKQEIQPDLVDVPCSLLFRILGSISLGTTVYHEKLQTMLMHALICLEGGWGQTRCIIGRLLAFEWLLTSVPKMSNVERFDCNVFYPLSFLFIPFFPCRVDPAYRQAHGR